MNIIAARKEGYPEKTGGLKVVGLPVAILFTLAASLLVACGGGDDEEAVRLLQQFLQVGQGPRTTVEVIPGRLGLVEGFPSDPALYSPAEVVLSFRVSDVNSVGFFAMLTTADARDQVAAFFEKELEDGGWRITGSAESRDDISFQFEQSRPRDRSGSVAVTATKDGQGNAITISLFERDGVGGDSAFEPGRDLPLPRGFPASMPVYPGSTVIDTAWELTSEGSDFTLRFVTGDSEDQVILFYEQELPNNGWQVADEFPGPDVSTIFIADPISQRTAGFIATRQFPEDDRFVEVILQISIIERQ